MVGRLSLYLRELQNLLREGQQTTSSTQLGRLLGFSDAQVRKDLAQRQIKGGIIAVPGVAAQQVAETLVATGLEGVLNLPPSH